MSKLKGSKSTGKKITTADLYRDLHLCLICDKPLPPNVVEYAKRHVQRTTCGSDACRRAEDILYGRLCCDKAQYTPCVCTYSSTCPVHGEIHRGTHD